jgi:hypothetical protein
MSKLFGGPGVHLGPTGSFTTFNQAALPAGYEGHLGEVFQHGTKAFRLVKFDNGSAVAAADGAVLYWLDKANGVVTSDASAGEALANGVAGGCHVVATDLNYIFIQVGGDQAAVSVAASTAIGEHLSGHASTDLVLTRTAAATANVNKTVAIALSAVGTTTTDNGASLATSSKVRWEFGALL